LRENAETGEAHKADRDNLPYIVILVSYTAFTAPRKGRREPRPELKNNKQKQLGKKVIKIVNTFRDVCQQHYPCVLVDHAIFS
jgi:hypothetical protein